MAANASSMLAAGVVAEKFAERVGVPEDEQRKFLVLGYALGAKPIGLAITLALANQEAEQAAGSQPVTQPAPLKIATVNLPDGQTNQKYSVRLAAIGGQSPYAWALENGKLPPALTLNPATGIIAGTPTSTDEGPVDITVQVTDAAGTTADAEFKFKIAEAITARK